MSTLLKSMLEELHNYKEIILPTTRLITTIEKTNVDLNIKAKSDE